MIANDALPSELIEQFVLNAHGNFGRVRELHEQQPELLNARWARFDEDALQAAGHTGRREIAQYLLAQGAPLTLYAAAMLGQTEAVASFLQEDPELARTPGVHGFSAMFHAAYSGRIEIAELLLAQGGDQGMDAAVHAAVAAGHLDMVRWLLDHGASASSPNYEGKTPLQAATDHGHDTIADLLRERGAAQ